MVGESAMMNLRCCLVMTILLLPSLARAVVLPAKDLNGAPVNDPFLGYQWALFNHDQSIIIDLDDIHPVEIHADAQFSIHWRNFDSLMKRDVVVAVIDTGVDSSHFELKGKLLPGVNVATRKREERNLPDDDLGHGTHMSSIMAAQSGNREGMAGLSNRIKVLPIKFFDKNETPDNRGRKPLTERIIEALNIAIEQKVDVINMSIGWPRSANTKDVESAFQRALDQGIVIVVGAGNDHHEAQIYPCAYRGVICVGSVNMDGKVSDYSNFGGHVDVLAPGQGILGLWPVTMASKNFGPKGYEIKSGTSQATPMVAGTAAILRGIYPEESATQIRQRLLSSTKRGYPEVNFGLLDMAAAVEMEHPQLTAPVFKGIEMLVVDPHTKQFELPLVVESDALQNLNIQVESLSPDIQLTNLREVKSQEGLRHYRLDGQLSDMNVSNRLRYKVRVNGKAFEHQLLLVTELKKLSPISVPNIEGKLAQVNDPRGNRQIQFWNTEELQEGGLKLMLWRLAGKEWVKREVSLPLVDKAYPGGIGLTLNDWSLKGGDEYLFAGIAYEEKRNEKNEKVPKEVRFFYLNRDLQIEHEWPLKAADTLPAYQNARDMVLGRVADGRGGFIKTPVFWSTDLIPKLDLNPDVFAFESNEKKRRIYFLQALQDKDGAHLTTRTLTAWALDNFMRKTLDLDATQDVELIGLKTQSLEDIKLGRIKLVLFAGRLMNGRTYELSISDMLDPWKRENLKELNTGALQLKGSAFEEAFLLRGQTIDRLTEMQNLYSFISGRSLFEEGSGFRQQKFELDLTGEKIMSTLKSFVRGQEQVSILATTDFIRAQGQWDGRKVNSQVAVYRSSFLPGNMFNQVLMPVLIGSEQRPGIMMDNSKFFSHSISVYALNKNGELKSPVRLSFLMPEGCVAAPLSYWNELGYSRILLRCQTEGTSGEILMMDLQ